MLGAAFAFGAKASDRARAAAVPTCCMNCLELRSSCVFDARSTV